MVEVQYRTATGIFNGVEFHYNSATVKFYMWWKSSKELQPKFDGMEFHCSNATVRFSGVEFQLRFNITEFVHPLICM